MVFLKEFLEKVYFEKKISSQQKSMQNYPEGKEIYSLLQKFKPFPAIHDKSYLLSHLLT